MITYKPSDWFTFIFRFHRSDTVRTLFWMMIAIGAYSAIIAWLELEFWKISENSHVRNLSIIHSLLGFVLSLLLVFRTNTAYDRWWEGRKLWGALVNTSRNMAIQLHSMLPYEDKANRRFFAHVIPMYAVLLKDHLRSEKTRLELDESEHPELKDLHTKNHRPNQLAAIMQHRIYRLAAENKINAEQLINLNAQLLAFTDICGGCERIKNTPIPYSYSVFVKKFIFFFVMTLPFGFVFNLGYFVIPVVIFIFYALASLEIIAEEIEEPFGGDSNDIPTEKIAKTIEQNIRELLG